MLSNHFSKAEMLARAAEVDTGFDHAVFANLGRYSDTDLRLGGIDVARLRQFFEAWLSELRPPR
jgi:hypothetical protein